MSIAIHDLSHAFASAAHDVMTGAKAVVSWEQRKLNPNAAEIELITSLIPGVGPQIEIMERLAFATFGVAAALLHVNGGDVQKAAAANPALTPELLTEVQVFMQANPALVTKATNLVKST